MELTYKQTAEQELREIAQRVTLLENQLEKESQDRLSEFQGIRLEFAGLRTDLKSQGAELESLQGRISNVTLWLEGSTVVQDHKSG